ncbi:MULTISPECIES: nucleoside 2-deoxyribosyltransferase [unclassified Bradyrhizobium]|uniref:nucleoside 2-deoxyribosyltransferase n=1 Tax=unclassified Bradyrhizobium TaxID=2631580 RepID=UPI0028E807E6|nr:MULTISPECIES: nucleoside 2-deoxyribosyltransferase [unclassified Bradyrhizobium]
MTASTNAPLLVGEVFVDYTITRPGSENKLRLGGVSHAARGFWALGQPFRAAIIVPDYLEELTRDYFTQLGCVELVVMGRVAGAPNITLIFDEIEVADQEYDTPLRDEKVVRLTDLSKALEQTEDALIFPGAFSLTEACAMLPAAARLYIDVAYDVEAPGVLAELNRSVEVIFISTSSPLFLEMGEQNVQGVAAVFASCKPRYVILKHNRGGAELLDCSVVPHQNERLPAQLGTTINSVGVGDVFAATFLTALPQGAAAAGWRATYAAAAYSQTTYPDIFRTYVERDQRLSLDDMKSLGGTFLPWSARPLVQVYFAAPDFANADRAAIDQALKALSYHNFAPRRPVVENGELPPNSDPATLRTVYEKDYELLKKCTMVFAVPTGRDPGTLVEIGIAIEAGIPVVTYDADGKNNNTMVIAGSSFYSSDLDACLNATFRLLSQD